MSSGSTDSVHVPNGRTVSGSISSGTVSGDRHAPTLATAGSYSTGGGAPAPRSSAKRNELPVRERPRIRHACRAILANCVQNLERARDAGSDIVPKSNALQEVKDSLADLWRMRSDREEQFAELINQLQAVFVNRQVEDFTHEQLDVLESVLAKMHDEPRFNDSFANSISMELLRGGVDVFRELD